MKKVDKERYESDPVYRERVDAQREKQRIYQREWARKKYAENKGKKKEEKPKAEPLPNDCFREVVCLGCAPDRACILNIPTSAFPGETAILHCPCDGEMVKGVAR